jgi:hypothetical protein
MSPAEFTPPSKSTGPRTPAGRAISSHNATRHGLTGRVVVLPSEDMNVYNAFCKELMADLAPETPLERQYAQTFCDTQWRLNRARSYEDGLLALGHFEHADSIGIDHPEALAALTAAKAFRENSKAFVNLSLYEQRLQRAQKEALRQLQELQAKRIAARQTDLDEAVALHNLHKMKGQPFEVDANQFVFSTAEIAAEARRQDLRQTLRAKAKPARHSESPLRHTA